MRVVVAFVSLSVLALAVACSSSSTGGGGGASGSVGEQCDRVATAYCTHAITDCKGGQSASAATAGDQCTEIGTALCARSVACGTAASTTCVSTFVNTCCGAKGLCGAASASTASVIASCTSAIGAQTCDEVNAGTSPTACTGVIQTALPSTVSDCVTQGHAGCCGDSGKCAQAAQSSSGAIDACVQSIQTSTCTTASDLPASCQGVVQTSSAAIHVESAELAGAHRDLASRVFGGREIGARVASPSGE